MWPPSVLTSLSSETNDTSEKVERVSTRRAGTSRAKELRLLKYLLILTPFAANSAFSWPLGFCSSWRIILTRLSLLLFLSRSPRSEATFRGSRFLPCDEPLPFASAVVNRLPLRRVGPSVRLASKASTRKRLVFVIDITVFISVLSIRQSGQITGGLRSALTVPKCAETI